MNKVHRNDELYNHNTRRSHCTILQCFYVSSHTRPCACGSYFLAVILSCIKSDRYFGAIDENKNLDIGLYIENHIDYIQTIKRWGYIEPDYPSWPQNVVLPYRPWDNENQVPIY